MAGFQDIVAFVTKSHLTFKLFLVLIIVWAANMFVTCPRARKDRPTETYICSMNGLIGIVSIFALAVWLGKFGGLDKAKVLWASVVGGGSLLGSSAFEYSPITPLSPTPFY